MAKSKSTAKQGYDFSGIMTPTKLRKRTGTGNLITPKYIFNFLVFFFAVTGIVNTVNSFIRPKIATSVYSYYDMETGGMEARTRDLTESNGIFYLIDENGREVQIPKEKIQKTIVLYRQ